MDDSLEDEIIYEMMCAHVHLVWKYLSVTSSSISDMALPSTGEGYKTRLVKLGPLVVLTLVVIAASFLLQNGTNWLQDLLVGCQQSIKLKVAANQGLKNLVSSSIISGDSISHDLQEGIVGVYAMQGRRATMEDRFSVQQEVSIYDGRTISFFGVFDGHGGQYVAEFVKQNLFTNTLDKIRELQLNSPKMSKNGSLNGPKDVPDSKGRRKSSGSIASNNKAANSTDRRHSLNESSLANLVSIQESSKDTSPFEEGTSSTEPCDADNQKPSNPLEGACCVKNLLPTSSPTSKESCPVETVSDKPPEDTQPLKQKEDPYSAVSAKKRNSIASPGADANSFKQETAPDRDALYVDSHNNINYTRLLTDQLTNIDKKVVDHCKSRGDLSGTTAVIAILDGDLLIIGNVGDSRAVMADIKGATIPLSFDHKPNQLKERRRIRDAGGYITFTGVWRVAGILATSRAVGDFPLKDPRKLITAEPDVLTFSIKDHKAHFVILATDGLWDVLSNEEAVDFVRKHIHEYDYGAKSLSMHAYSLGSQDNITVSIINLSKK